MARATLNFGLALTALGIASYALAGGSSLTALIPSIFGGLLLLCGLALHRQGDVNARPPALLIATTVTALGLLVVAPRVVRGVPKLLDGPTLASVSQLLLLVGLAGYMVLAVRHLLKRGD